MADPVMLEVRERRSRFGRLCVWAFWIHQGATVLLTLGTCAAITPVLTSPDPEAAAGAGLFGVMAIGTLWSIWPFATALLGLAALLTRGRKRLIPAPPEGAPGAWAPAGGETPQPAPAPRRPGGSVPPTGPAQG